MPPADMDERFSVVLLIYTLQRLGAPQKELGVSAQNAMRRGRYHLPVAATLGG